MANRLACWSLASCTVRAPVSQSSTQQLSQQNLGTDLIFLYPVRAAACLRLHNSVQVPISSAPLYIWWHSSWMVRVAKALWKPREGLVIFRRANMAWEPLLPQHFMPGTWKHHFRIQACHTAREEGDGPNPDSPCNAFGTGDPGKCPHTVDQEAKPRDASCHNYSRPMSQYPATKQKKAIRL